MRALRVLGILLLAVALVFAVMLTLGGLQPRSHTVSASVTVPAPQIAVWQRITDIQAQPGWRTGLIEVQPLPARDGHRCWMEMQSYGKMPLCEVLAVVPTTRIVSVADPKLAFGGDWVYTLTPRDAKSTNLILTENGTTGPWVWRFMGHYVFHEDTMIKQYEADLVKSFGKP